VAAAAFVVLSDFGVVGVLACFLASFTGDFGLSLTGDFGLSFTGDFGLSAGSSVFGASSVFSATVSFFSFSSVGLTSGFVSFFSTSFLDSVGFGFG